MDLYKFNHQPYFSIEGKFLGFVRESKGKVKYLRIAVGNDELQIKLSKASRTSFNQNLLPGDRIQVVGQKKEHRLDAQPKLKAYWINKLNNYSLELCPKSDMAENWVQPDFIPPKKRSFYEQPKARILVCQKSGCWKRGGKKLCQELETALCDRGLQNHVAIEPTGCMKRCSSAPNMMLMPGKTRCSKMHPSEVADLLAQHLVPDLNR